MKRNSLPMSKKYTLTQTKVIAAAMAKERVEEARKLAGTIAYRKYGIVWLRLFRHKRWLIRKLSRWLYRIGKRK